MNKEHYSVAINKRENVSYPIKPPFHPHEKYPEYPFDEISDAENHIYEMMRELFVLQGLDKYNYGQKEWNPLKEFVSPGSTVVLKPNFVLSRHPDNKDIYSVITHPSVLRTIADYCWIALKNQGKILIADAPQYNCNFDELMEKTKLNEIKDYINTKGEVIMEIVDLRNYWATKRHFPSYTRTLPGDPSGSVVVNLGKESANFDHPNPNRVYGAVYDRRETISHHSGKIQEYMVSKTILDADTYISVPKLKTHKKVGVTLNLKNLVGICTNKNFIIHYTLGTPEEGGDQFPHGLLTAKEKLIIEFERWMYDHFLSHRTRFHEYIHRFIYGFLYLKIFRHFNLDIPEEKRLLDAGNWYGNDSAWRMVVDLAKIINFSNKDGVMEKNRSRKILSIVDGIIGGEGNGPLSPDPINAGMLISGSNLLAVDMVATHSMGFNPNKLKQFTQWDKNFPLGPNSLDDIEIITNASKTKHLHFRPHPGWIGHIES